MKATIACALLTCQSLVMYWLLWHCQIEHKPPTEHPVGTSMPLSEYPLRYAPDGSVGIGTPTLLPEHQYILRGDGSEWYAPGVDYAEVQQRLFQARCLLGVRCL